MTVQHIVFNCSRSSKSAVLCCTVLYSRVSGAVGRVPDGHVVVLLAAGGGADPVEGAGAARQPGGEPAGQHHVLALPHVPHAGASLLAA